MEPSKKSSDGVKRPHPFSIFKHTRKFDFYNKKPEAQEHDERLHFSCVLRAQVWLRKLSTNHSFKERDYGEKMRSVYVDGPKIIFYFKNPF